MSPKSVITKEHVKTHGIFTVLNMLNLIYGWGGAVARWPNG